jgi:hypothetical protein
MNQHADSLKTNLPAIVTASRFFHMTLAFESHSAAQKTRKVNRSRAKRLRGAFRGFPLDPFAFDPAEHPRHRSLQKR